MDGKRITSRHGVVTQRSDYSEATPAQDSLGPNYDVVQLATEDTGPYDVLNHNRKITTRPKPATGGDKASNDFLDANEHFTCTTNAISTGEHKESNSY